ncbi:RNA polymerase sigma factor [Flectobacillus longus]|uniref:RNA polymerase sigma factor n=1 Tax=Flectobacillus longus TaxID=2984207 RepID=UPI0024B85C4A|nr:sigma-70 family RNA polymerase sigma factor [Flectobacillus longus]MDI9882665.1 sigma-70 family RNA polymerase sigma factor [Flectobacillus longus]
MAIKISDETLWKRLREGDELAFSTLFERYFRSLVNYGNSLMAYSDKVQDCVQDVFVDIWIYRNSLQESVVVKAYLIASLRRRAFRMVERDHIFNKATSDEKLDFLIDFSIEDQLIHEEFTAIKVKRLNELLNQLPSRQKEAIYLRYHQGLNIEQIAETMDINYQSANNLIYRGLQQIRSAWPEDFALVLLMISEYL